MLSWCTRSNVDAKLIIDKVESKLEHEPIGYYFNTQQHINMSSFSFKLEKYLSRAK